MKRPTPKLPEVQAPVFLVDLYYDLRDRRLLLPIALVLVAIAATPILLGRSSEPRHAAAEGAITALKEQGGREDSTLTVVEATPGLRDYRKRLRNRAPTDPFKQRYTAPVLKGAELPKAESSGGSGGATGGEQVPGGSAGSQTGGGSGDATAGGGSGHTTTGGAPGDETGGSGGKQKSDGGRDGGKPQTVLYSFAADLQIIHVSGSKAGGDKRVSEPDVRKKVLPPAPLPGKKLPVVTYMGLSPKTRKPLFLVSSDVTGTFGEGKCVSGIGNCQLIELEPGFPQTFEYGDSGDRYKLKVTRVKVVFKGRL